MTTETSSDEADTLLSKKPMRRSARITPPRKTSKRIVVSDSSLSEFEVSDQSDESDQSHSPSENDIEEIKLPSAPMATIPQIELEIANDAQILTMKPKVKRPRAPKKPKVPKPEFTDLHPEVKNIWENLDSAPKIEVERIDQPQDILIKLLPFQREGINWMIKQEASHFNGGVLADDMGLGKTIQMITLMVTNVRRTLLVCPTVAMLQWIKEIETRVTPGILKILFFHGTNRPTKIPDEYNVILTSFAVLEQLYRKQHSGVKRKGVLFKEKSLLHGIEWGRVVLDEAHCIKDRSCNTARAVFMLKKQKQWAITGTPLQNRVGELYSLIRFMDLDPFSYYFCKVCPCKMKTWKFTDHIRCDDCGHTGHQHFCWW